MIVPSAVFFTRAVADIYVIFVVPVQGKRKARLRLHFVPLLAEGGDIQSAGAAIVGEAGPELLDLPKGARVTPLNGDSAVGIDYEKLMETFVAALRLVAPELRPTIQGDVDRDALVRFLVKENRSSQYMYGKGLLEL